MIRIHKQQSAAHFMPCHYQHCIFNIEIPTSTFGETKILDPQSVHYYRSKSISGMHDSKLSLNALPAKTEIALGRSSMFTVNSTYSSLFGPETEDKASYGNHHTRLKTIQLMAAKRINNHFFRQVTEVDSKRVEVWGQKEDGAINPAVLNVFTTE